MCNIVKSRVNNSTSSRTYTQEARETPFWNFITLTCGTAVKFSKDEGIFVSLATNSCRTRDMGMYGIPALVQSIQVIQWINIYPADTVLNNWALFTKYWKSSSYSFCSESIKLLGLPILGIMMHHYVKYPPVSWPLTLTLFSWLLDCGTTSFWSLINICAI
jgi:hypothetical protein